MPTSNFSSFVLFFLFSALLLNADETKSDAAIRELVKQLGDNNYLVRDKATKELLKTSLSHLAILKEELKNTKDLEVQERLTIILDPSGEKLKEIFSESILKSQNFLQDKKYAEALKEIDVILEIRPDFEQALNIKIDILEEKADYAECILLLKKRIETSEKDTIEAETFSNKIARILLISGAYAEAVTHLEKMEAQSRYPDQVQRFLTYAYELNKQTEKAEAILIKESELNQKEAHYSSSIAWFYIRTGKQDKANKFLEKYFAQLKDNKDTDISEVLNYLLSDQLKKGAEKLITVTAPMLAQLKDKKNLTSSEIANEQVFNLCYQHYFEVMSGIKPNINFKALYNSIDTEERKTWPMPLLGLFGGELTLDKLEAQLQSLDKWEMRMNKCEAYFYLGLLRVSEKNTVDAKKYFELSKSQNVYEYIETTGDYYMLQKLK